MLEITTIIIMIAIITIMYYTIGSVHFTFINTVTQQYR